jgi:hypothetical protein
MATTKVNNRNESQPQETPVSSEQTDNVAQDTQDTQDTIIIAAWYGPYITSHANIHPTPALKRVAA